MRLNLEFENQLYLLYVHPTLSVADSLYLQFINLLCSVSQSSNESETKSDSN